MIDWTSGRGQLTPALWTALACWPGHCTGMPSMCGWCRWHKQTGCLWPRRCGMSLPRSHLHVHAQLNSAASLFACVQARQSTCWREQGVSLGQVVRPLQRAAADQDLVAARGLASTKGCLLGSEGVQLCQRQLCGSRADAEAARQLGLQQSGVSSAVALVDEDHNARPGQLLHLGSRGSDSAAQLLAGGCECLDVCKAQPRQEPQLEDGRALQQLAQGWPAAAAV